MKNMKLPEKIIGIGLMVMALAVYLITLSRGACPGSSAALIVSHGGLVPRFSPASPLWTAMVAAIRAVSGDNFVIMLNLSSAICGALSVGLLYNLMSEGVLVFISELSFSEKKRRIASVIAGSTASLAFAFCIPFWIVSNRAHTASFDILFLLITARLLLAYMDYGKMWIALVFSFLFGMGVVEFSTFIVIAPVFGVWLLYVMWKRNVLRLSVVLSLIGCAVFGMMLYLLAAWGFYKSQGYELMKYDGFFDIIWHMWRSQYQMITRGLPREGWLIILFVTVVPWLAMFSVVKRGLNDERDWGLYFLHLIMTAIVVAVLLNTRIAPYRITGQYRLLVTPYLLISMVLGYLAAYWFLLPSGWGRAPEEISTRFFRQVFGWILLVPLVAVLGFVAINNISETSTEETGFVREFADEVIDCLDGREWLVSNGILDESFMLAANRKGIPLKIINLRSGVSTVYLDYLASLFEKPRMKNLAKIGIPALLTEWMKNDPDISKKIAILTMPDIWTRYGFKAIPNKLLFLGTKDVSKIDVDALQADTEAFWKRYKTLLKKWAPRISDKTMYKFGQQHAGLVANNFGVFLEDQNRSKDAFKAYKTAREIDPNNISSLLNMSSMVSAGKADDSDGSIKTAFDAFKSKKEKSHMWALARYNGYVRSPGAFAQMGLTWARSGQAGMAISELEKAEKMLPSKSKNGVRQLMTDILMANNKSAESAKIYKKILLSDKHNQNALSGMVAVCIDQHRYVEAEQFLDLSAKNGVKPEKIELQRALIKYLSGDTKKARKILDDLLLENRELLQGWFLLSNIAFSDKDDATIDKCLRRVENIEGDRGYFGSVIRARRAMRKHDFAAVADYYEMALSRKPANSAIREMLLPLERSLGRKEALKKNIKVLLLENPNNAMALYMRGSLQEEEGELDLAEDSLRLSIRSSKTMQALNDLAMLVQAKGKFKEAETLINEAIQLNDKHPAVWDTKGIILLGLKQYKAAVDAFGRSLAILETPSTTLHMGQAQLALGNIKVVKDIIKKIEPIRDSLQPEDREILGKLQLGVK